MSRSSLGYALLLSILLNVGVIGAAGYHAFRERNAQRFDLPEYLRLDAGQRRPWQDLEGGFLREFDATGAEILARRAGLIREIFSDQPDPARIEAQRAAIAKLQERQQQRVIAQFLKERQILDARQRRALADLLLEEAPGAPLERQLHRP